MSYPTQHESTLALARLPWFDLQDGRLVVDPAIGPAVDVHTHVALAYVRKMRVDLWQEHERVELYLPFERELDLEVYANRNFSAQDLKKLKRDLTLKSLTKKGMRATHTAANLLGHMRDQGVTHSVLLPIDLRWLPRNASSYLEAAAGREELICFGSVHPKRRDMAAMLDAQKAAGAVGIKHHPAVQLIAPDDPKSLELYRLCGERGLMILWHCGPVGIEMKKGRELSQVKGYRQGIAENPDTTFILGHSGALQFEEALALALEFENVYLESSSQGIENVRRLVTEAPRDRVLFGSDWPFYHQSLPLVKLLMVTEDDQEMRRKVLWENAARLFGLSEPK